uniref:XPG N-terminal domain-containing protein n=1 Tax=Strigamia maritima TaxID=126957 RepID=T1JN56_STRMM
MGIMSLTSFLDSFPQMLNSFRLHDTKVVIDGNNLCHALYHDCGVSCFFGGDYDKFAARTKEYFVIYKKCGITPIIIFDGAYNERKLKTSTKRARERQLIARNFSQGKLLKHRERKGILPILAMDVLHDVLNDMKIQSVQCTFEADSQIAAIANYFQCPVLSLDSDFYIYDVTGGFIPLNLIDMGIKRKTDESESYKFLDCKIYYVDNFLREFDTADRSTLPLFGTLLGNDFVSTSTFQHFFAQLKIEKLKLRKHKFGTRHQKIIGLLIWLQTRTKEEAIINVLNFFKKDYRERLKTIIHETIEGYTQIEPSNIVNILTKETKIWTESTKDEVDMPKWFIDDFNHGILPPFMLNAVVHQRVVLPVQTECQDKASSYNIARPLRRLIYGLLFSIKNTDASVNEYDRVGYNLQNIKTDTINELPIFGSLPVLPDINSTSAKILMLEVLCADENVFPTLPPGLRFVLLIVRYWILKADPQVTDCEVYSITLCILFLSVIDKKTKFKKSFKTLNFPLDVVLENASNSDFQDVDLKLTKFRKAPEFTRIRNFNVSLVHNFSQLQTCILYAFYLNSLFKFPFTPVSASKLFNGTFLYNVCVDLQSRACPRSYVMHLLSDNTAAVDLFNYVTDSMLATLPSDATLKRSCHNKKRRQKKKSRTTDRCVTTPEASEDGDNSENDASEFKYEITVDVCNKFQALLN